MNRSVPQPMYAWTASQMLTALETGEVSSVQLVDALGRRARAVNSRLNAVIVDLFAEARRQAVAADLLRARGGGGPLCGLPMTIKENFDLVGTASTLGVRARRDHRPKSDAVLVQHLREAGVVIIGKTNVPQLLLAQETDNAVWGVCRNPWHVDRAPGGSSGGEAAAIAAGLSPLGIGSDIGGSIRIPCHFTGIAGLKPTVDRWSVRGMQGALPGQELVRAMAGPMARSVDDLILLWKTLDPVAMSAEDPRVAPLPAGDPDAVDLSELRIGYYADDGYLSPTPAIQRAVAEARAALEARGATLVPFQEPDAGEVLFVWLSAITSDGGEIYRRVLDGEAFGPLLRPGRQLADLPDVARRALKAVLRRVGDGRVARLVDTLGRKSVADYWDFTAARSHLRMQSFDAWNAADVDAVICPPHVVPALPHGESADFVLSLSYMFRYALFNQPAGVVPVTRVTDDDISRTPPGGDRVERKRASIDARSLGLPVGVQVASRAYREDITLAVMQAIERGVRDEPQYPRTPIDPMP